MNATGETILAPATPPGTSARALIRFSGPAVPRLAQAMLDRPLPDRELTPRRLRLRHTRCSLPILATSFHPPRSYTAEHVLELQLPGNPALLERVMDEAIVAGDRLGVAVRFAEAGEFTRRAFGAGRIDLARAEGIAATIGAVSDGQLRAAALLRRGRLGQWATALVDQLAHVLALVEAGIDFTDQDDVVAITPGQLRASLEEIAGQIARMLADSRPWADVQSLAWVVLVGRPNAGKSTLFNALLGRERAVTSAVAGTTRDVLAEPLKLGGAEVMLVDIAGLDEADGLIETAMRSAADEAVQRADLLVVLAEDDEPFSPPRDDVPIIRVRSKADQPVAVASDAEVAVSGTTGRGLGALRQRIAERLADRLVAVGGEVLCLQPRHGDCLRRCAAEIDRAREQSEPEMIAAALRTALDHLGEVGGRMSPDDVIGKVFATFCVGK